MGTDHRPEPTVFVIFGGAGDLSWRKLIPALYNLAHDGQLPGSFAVVGFARRPKTTEEFRAELRDEHRDDPLTHLDTTVCGQYANARALVTLADELVGSGILPPDTAARIVKFIEGYRRSCAEAQIDYVLTDTSVPYDFMLSKYIAKRNRL